MIRYFFVLFTVAVVGCGATRAEHDPANAGANGGAASGTSDGQGGFSAGGSDSGSLNTAGASAGDAPSTAGASAGASGPLGRPLPSGTYAATYEVPVPVELSRAAIYEIAEVNWSIDADGAVQLEYELPRGLVGTSIQVTLEGRFDATTRTATLSGDAGTAECTISPSAVACSEKLLNLAPIDTDLTVVSALAASEFAGPAEQRVDVATRFSADPIGIVHIDVSNAGGGKSN